MKSAGSDNTTFTPAAGNKGCVGCHTTAGGKDTFCSTHSFNVFRIGLFAKKNNFLSFTEPCNSILGCKYNLTDSCSGACRQTLD